MKESREEICEDCSYWLKDNLSMRHESIYKYDQLMRKFFVAYKLQGDYRLKSVFAARLRERLIKYEDYTIVPVPVSRKTLEERGFCQVTSMLEAADIPYLNLFNKSESGSQKFKNRQERLSSQNPFSLIEGISIPNKILIFDDIYTSGRTIAHLLNLLRDVKGLEIRSLSLAR
ncbi:ComF family protein [Streptococcaceae bacterium ESL0687]|nr:ComF family protein [Streptococcaceae bacterium ESL0687]